MFLTYRLSSIASGDFHCLGLGRRGGVFTWGYGAEGQMGNGNIYHLRTPCRIVALEDKNINRIVCGASWSFAISKEGELYGWGHGDGGWLGIMMPLPTQSLPYIDAEEPSNAQFQPQFIEASALSLSSSFESRLNVLTPRLVEAYRGHVIRKVRCGADFTLIVSTGSSAPQFMTTAIEVTSSISHELSEDVITWCRHGRSEELRRYLNESIGIQGGLEAVDMYGVRYSRCIVDYLTTLLLSYCMNDM
jgi:hypothetical protein